MDISDEGRIEKRFGFLPEVIAGFAVPFGVGDQGVDEFQNVFFRVDILKRVVVMGLLEIDCVEDSNLVVISLEELAALDYDAAFEMRVVKMYRRSFSLFSSYNID